MPNIDLTEAELALLREALDSHEYWQLSESHERNNGYSLIEDGANEEIDAVRALDAKLCALMPSPPGAPVVANQAAAQRPSDP